MSDGSSQSDAQPTQRRRITESASENEPAKSQGSGRSVCCHCRRPPSTPVFTCSLCGEQFHKKCIPDAQHPSGDPSGYECSHCNRFRAKIGHLATGGIFQDVAPRARNAYLRHYDKPKAELSRHLVAICSCTKPSTKLTKEHLCRSIIWAEYGVDLPKKPSLPDPIVAFLAEPPLLTNSAGVPSLSIAGKLHADLVEAGTEFPGIGREPGPPVTELGHSVGLLPHVMRHLDSSYAHHGHNAGELAINFVSGIKHWNGFHGPPHCGKADTRCQDADCGRIPTVANEEATARLLRILENCVFRAAVYLLCISSI